MVIEEEYKQRRPDGTEMKEEEYETDIADDEEVMDKPQH